MHVDRLRELGVVRKCRECGQEIIFAHTKNNRFMPISAISLKPHFADCDKNLVKRLDKKFAV